MDRINESESRDWAELRASLMALLDNVHEQRQKQEEHEKSKHVISIKMSVRVIGRKDKRKRRKDTIAIL